LANVLITLFAVLGLGLYNYFSTTQANSYLIGQLDRSVYQQALDSLSATSNEQTSRLNEFFLDLRKDLTTLGKTLERMISEPDTGTVKYWDATSALVRLPNGSWDNSNGEVASVFIPAAMDLSPRLAHELDAGRQIDYLVPALLEDHPDLVAVYFGGLTGETIYYPNVDLSNIVPPDFDVTQRTWFLAAEPGNNPERQPAWSAPYLDAALNGLVITVSTPVYDRNGIFRGSTAMDIQLNQITEIVSNIRVGETGYAFLIDRDRRIIAMPAEAYQDLGLAQETLPLGETLTEDKAGSSLPAEFWQAIENMAEGQTRTDILSIGGTDRFIIYQPVSEVGYELAIIVPTQELLADAIAANQEITRTTNRTVLISVFLGGTILVLALLLTLGIGERITRPLARLTATAEEISQGNFNVRAEIRSNDEYGTLARAFNEMTSRLGDLVANLENRVVERTTDLELATRRSEQRATQFETIAQVAREIATLQNVELVLNLITDLISMKFGFYHVGIFLNDENQEFVVLRAANSDGGKNMLTRGHKLKIGEVGIVGMVAQEGKARIALETSTDEVYFKNPDLPYTRSEMALPLRIGSRVIGVIDVQSTESNAFTQEDSEVMAVLADQVSVAIENARLFETTQRSLSEAELVYRDYLRKEWTRFSREQLLPGFVHTGAETKALDAPVETPEIEHALLAGKTTVDESAGQLIVPVKLRGETIGVIEIRLPEGERATKDKVDVAEAVADRLGLSAENARLFEETTRRADRERAVSDITTAIRSKSTPEEMLKTALEELQNALGVRDIQIKPFTAADPSASDEGVTAK
jgi:GAF domain-containing protein/HAMP domain-containing protein